MKVHNRAERAEVLIYEDIGEGFFGGVSAKVFAEALKPLKGKPLDVRINSYGGNVFDGFAIYNALKRHGDVSVYVDGIAASAASVVAMAGASVEVAENGFLMIHDPWAAAGGSAAEFRRQADLLDEVGGKIRDLYAARTGLSAEEVAAMMAAETWMDAGAAVDLGFADRVGAAQKLAAWANKYPYRNLPGRVTSPARDDTRKRLAAMTLHLKKETRR